MALGGILPLLFAPLLIWLLPESVRFLVIKQAPAARIRAILNRLYPGQISDNLRFILPAQPAAGNAMRIVPLPPVRFRLADAMAGLLYGAVPGLYPRQLAANAG